MRQVVLDTETTGLAIEQGHRIIEVGCLELVNRRLTGNRLHYYLQPDRSIESSALEVHGLSESFLADKPRFREVASEFVNFIHEAELIIHNAAFDIGFLNRELELLDASWGKITDYCTVTCTLELARQLYPGQRNSLDGLCKRYNIDNAHRQRHDALTDTELLAQVYLAMTGGQVSLLAEGAYSTEQRTLSRRVDPERPRLPVLAPSKEELSAHWSRLSAIREASGGRCVWDAIEEKFLEG